MFDRFRRKKLKGIVEVSGGDSRDRGAQLIGSSDQQFVYGTIRKGLTDAKFIEASVNPATAAKISTSSLDASYPDDINDFQDYFDAYNYVSHVHRAVDIKHSMIWQMGYDLESESEASKTKVDDLLRELQADTVIRDGSLLALIFGNMYWQKTKEGGVRKLRALNPSRMGAKLDSKGLVTQYVYSSKMNERESFKPEEIIHLKVNAAPHELFGTSTLRNVLPTVKALLYMEEKLPLIARRRGEPLLAIQIGDKDNPVDEATFKKNKQGIVDRKSGEDIFHDGILTIQEVYQSASVGGRQTIEPLLAHFRQNLIAGLGVPDVALGFGGTSTMATAEYQERLLEAEVRDYQRVLKRMHESGIFSLVGESVNVKMVWRPLKEADKTALSAKMMAEIEHGVISPAWAMAALGYPADAGKGAVMSATLAPVGAMVGVKAEAREERELRLEALRKIAESRPEEKAPEKPVVNVHIDVPPVDLQPIGEAIRASRGKQPKRKKISKTVTDEDGSKMTEESIEESEFDEPRS
ncbi:phage portal protein [Candidatus Bathyarchaeota archaeon]|nr:phage portal protein [Candidatus Bathyarchaeota archaeon]